MIQIEIFKKQDDIVGYKVKGHAEYDDQGLDIVCSAVSVLAINTANSIETLCGKTALECASEDGVLTLTLLSKNLTDNDANTSSILLKSFEIGVKEIAKEYKDNVVIQYREVQSDAKNESSAVRQ